MSNDGFSHLNSLKEQVAAESEQAALDVVWHFNKGFQSLKEQILCYLSANGHHVNQKKAKSIRCFEANTSWQTKQ